MLSLVSASSSELAIGDRDCLRTLGATDSSSLLSLSWVYESNTSGVLLDVLQKDNLDAFRLPVSGDSASNKLFWSGVSQLIELTAEKRLLLRLRAATIDEKDEVVGVSPNETDFFILIDTDDDTDAGVVRDDSCNRDVPVTSTD